MCLAVLPKDPESEMVQVCGKQSYAALGGA